MKIIAIISLISSVGTEIKCKKKIMIEELCEERTEEFVLGEDAFRQPGQILTVKHQSHKMVKHAETICWQIVDELFECVWPFCEIGV